MLFDCTLQIAFLMLDIVIFFVLQPLSVLNALRIFLLFNLHLHANMITDHGVSILARIFTTVA
jgi:hypothetical protein